MIRQTKEGWWIIDGDTHLSKWVEESGRLDHDQNVLPLLYRYVRPRDTVIDIGANIGTMAKAFADWVGSKGHLYCFEPQNEAHECLVKNVPEARAFCYALGEERSMAAITKDQNRGASYLSAIADEGLSVNVETLDSFSTVLNVPPDFIKIDAEGYELKILKGGIKTIQKHKPILFLEVNEFALKRQGTFPEHLRQFVESLGYEIENVSDPGPQYDILCFPK